MNFINSFSLFGTIESKARYGGKLPIIIRQHYSLYTEDDWKLYIYYDNSIELIPYGRVLRKMHDDGLINLIEMKGCETHLCLAMLWRIQPIWDKSASYTFCRDLDSILTPRQAKFVYKFIASNKAAHGINDNKYHGIPLMGGMCGFKNDKFIRLTHLNSFGDLVQSAKLSNDDWKKHGTDQNVLQSIILPRVRNDMMIDKPEGPNERSHLKDCCPGISLPNVHKEVLERGDNFTNYIGADSMATTSHGSWGLKEVSDFYNQFGNQKYMEKIIKIEKDEGWTNVS